ncbi:hypothetical protein UlMin_015845 [Ulmus minor]
MATLSFRYICLLIFLISLVNHTKSYDQPFPLKNDKASSLFIFGDSAFDVGNNNYINTTGRANYWQYGETFFEYPTGRFSDGRLIPDFITEYVNLPLIPPYLQPDTHNFLCGANFASAGAGALVETSQGFVIDLKNQVSYFKNVSQVLRQNLGDEEAANLLSRAVYLFNVGSNDYSVLFQTNSNVLRSYSHQQFVRFVIGNITSAIEEIYKIGGRKFGFQNIRPIACIPYAKLLAGGKNGACLDKITPLIKLHNQQLSELLQKLQSELKGFRYSLLDYHTFLEERMNHPSKYGFKEAKMACCGSGPYRGIFSCGGKRGIAEYELCDNVSEYIFFDSAHPTERIYQQFAQQAWHYNLKALFESY